MKRFEFTATVSSERPEAIERVLREFVGAAGTIERTDAGFEVNASLEGASARDLNRQLLTGLRRVERKTRLRSEWSSGGVTEKFFDSVPKGTKEKGG